MGRVIVIQNTTSSYILLVSDIVSVAVFYNQNRIQLYFQLKNHGYTFNFENFDTPENISLKIAKILVDDTFDIFHLTEENIKNIVL